MFLALLSLHYPPRKNRTLRPFDAEAFTADLLQIVSKLTTRPVEELSPDDDLRDDIGLDSLQSMELLSRISERWGVDVDIEDVVGLRTVREVVELMSALIQKAPPKA
jgi:acyl carrier protein